MTLAALLWLPSWFDHFNATQHHHAGGGAGEAIGEAGSLPLGGGGPRAATLVERIQPWVGVVCSVGIIGVALDPEDERQAHKHPPSQLDFQEDL